LNTQSTLIGSINTAWVLKRYNQMRSKIKKNQIIFLLVTVLIITSLISYIILSKKEIPEKVIEENPLNLKPHLIEAYPNYLEGTIYFNQNRAEFKVDSVTYTLRPSDPSFYQERFGIKNNQEIKIQGSIENESHIVVGEIRK
jgi:hypothetical protein